MRVLVTERKPMEKEDCGGRGGGGGRGGWAPHQRLPGRINRREKSLAAR